VGGRCVHVGMVVLMATADGEAATGLTGVFEVALQPQASKTSARPSVGRCAVGNGARVVCGDFGETGNA